MPSWAIRQKKIAVWTCVCGSLVGEGVYWTTLSADITAAAQEGYNEQHQRCQHTWDLESIPTRAPSPIIIWKLPLNNNTIASLTGLLPLQPTPVLSTPFESCTCTLWAQGIIAEKLWPAKTESSSSHTFSFLTNFNSCSFSFILSHYLSYEPSRGYHNPPVVLSALFHGRATYFFILSE